MELKFLILKFNNEDTSNFMFHYTISFIEVLLLGTDMYLLGVFFFGQVYLHWLVVTSEYLI